MKNLTYKSVSVMKKTRESSNNQITLAEKQNLIACIASLGTTHAEITMFTPDNADLIAHGFTPSPRTIEAETQEWYDVIHAQPNVYGASVNGGYMKVLDRAVFPNMEGIAGYSVDKTTPIGTAITAASDGNSTWCGRYYNYLNTHITAAKIATNDILCPIPEISGPAFSGNFWTTQSGAQTCTIEFHKVATAFYASVGKTCVFMNNPNFSEVSSGWWGTYADTGIVCYDYYGNARGNRSVKPADYVFDLNQLYAGISPTAGYGIGTGGYPQFWCEWGDLSGSIYLGNNTVASGDNYVVGTTTVEAWMNYWIAFLKALRDNLVNTTPQKLKGFNYWGGWENQNTSILWKTGSGASSHYFPNWRGQILRDFFINDGRVRTPVPTGAYTEANPSFGGRQQYY